MINLDAISSRLGSGVVDPADVYAMLNEATSIGLSVDAAVAERVNRGYNDAKDAHYLFNALELEYSVAFGRPTGAEAFAKRQADEQAAQTQAQAKRAAQAQVQAAKDAQAQADRLAVAQQVSAQQEQSAAAQVVVDQFKAAQKAAAELLAKKQKVKDDFAEQLNG